MLADQLQNAQRQSAEPMLVLSLVFMLGVAFLIISNLRGARSHHKLSDRVPAAEAADKDVVPVRPAPDTVATRP